MKQDRRGGHVTTDWSDVTTHRSWKREGTKLPSQLLL